MTQSIEEERRGGKLLVPCACWVNFLTGPKEEITGILRMLLNSLDWRAATQGFKKMNKYGHGNETWKISCALAQNHTAAAHVNSRDRHCEGVDQREDWTRSSAVQSWTFCRSLLLSVCAHTLTPVCTGGALIPQLRRLCENLCHSKNFLPILLSMACFCLFVLCYILGFCHCLLLKTNLKTIKQAHTVAPYCCKKKYIYSTCT